MLLDDDDERNRLLGETIGSAVVDSSCSKTVCATRESFIRQESSECALARKVRPSFFFLNGDHVYYKRNDSCMWHGPAIVLGKDAQNYLLKHGGVYIHVHPCRIQLLGDKCDT